MKKRLEDAIAAWNQTHPDQEARVAWAGKPGGVKKADKLLGKTLGRAMGPATAALYEALPPFALELREGYRWWPTLHWHSAPEMADRHGFHFGEEFDSEVLLEVYGHGYPRMEPAALAAQIHQMYEDDDVFDAMAEKNPFRNFIDGDGSSDDWMLCFHDDDPEPEVWGFMAKDYVNLRMTLPAFFEEIINNPGWLLDNRALLEDHGPRYERRREAVAAMLEEMDE